MLYTTNQGNSRIIFFEDIPREEIGTLLHYGHEPVLTEGSILFALAESVDMMLILRHGTKASMVPTRSKSQTVDMQDNLKKVELLILDFDG